MSKKSEGWDSPENEVQNNWVKWNVSEADAPGKADKIHGTLIAKRQTVSSMAGKEGQKQWVYDIKADQETTYHALDDKKKLIDEPIVVVPGSIYSIGGTSVIDRQMQNIRVGQVIGLKFLEETPAKTKGYNPAKVVKVYAPKAEDGNGPLLDEEFLKQQELDNFNTHE